MTAEPWRVLCVAAAACGLAILSQTSSAQDVGIVPRRVGGDPTATLPGRGPYSILASGPDALLLFDQAASTLAPTTARIGWLDHRDGTLRDVGSNSFWLSDTTTDRPDSRRRTLFAGGVLAQHIGDSSGAELWRLDLAGRAWTRVAETVAGPVGGEPRLITSAAAFACFAAHDDTLRERLWRTDGASAGTQPVLPYGTAWSLARVGNAILAMGYLLDEDRTGLWRIDASGPPEPLLSLPGAYPGGMLSLGARIEFAISAGDAGTTVWRSDGTAAGTIPLATLPVAATLLASGPGDQSPCYLRAYLGNDVHDLWALSPGDGAARVAGPFASIDSAVCVGERLVFSATPLGTSDKELWASDASAPGTHRLDAAIGGRLTDPTVWCSGQIWGRAYFTAASAASGAELWSTDGTPVGTLRLTDIATGPASSNPHDALLINSRIYFAATDGVMPDDLWVLDLCPGDYNNDSGSSVQDLFEFLAGFFAGAAPADINGSGVISVQDLYDWLAAWFGGCQGT